MPPRPILIIEGDATLRATLAEQIALEGSFTAVGAESAAEATAKLSEADFRYDAILLDVRLSDADGRDFCAQLRRGGNTTPIIMLTGAHAEQDVVRGLDAGANDYVTKPFRLPELLARVRAQLRTFDNSEAAVFTVGPYQFRPSAKLLLGPSKNRKVRLTEKECRILKYLLQTNGAAVDPATLLTEVWGFNSGVIIHTLVAHIYRLRQKMEADPSRPRLLLTDRGAYRLDAAAPSAAGTEPALLRTH